MQLLETLLYIMIGFENIYCRHLYIVMCISRRVWDPGREVLIFNKYIHTLIKQIFDGSPSHTLYIC